MRSLLVLGFALGMSVTPALANDGAVILIEVIDYSQVPFSGVVSVGGQEYRFTELDAVPRESAGHMSIRRVRLPVARDVLLSSDGSKWPILICVQSAAGKPDYQSGKCLPTSAERIFAGVINAFLPEGWAK